MDDALTEALITGVQELIATAIEVEPLVSWRNRHRLARPFQNGIGPMKVRIPKV